MDFYFLIVCLVLINHSFASTTERQPRVISAQNAQKNRIREQITPERAEPEVKYQPTWESLDSRPLPQWYDDAKVGK